MDKLPDYDYLKGPLKDVLQTVEEARAKAKADKQAYYRFHNTPPGPGPALALSKPGWYKPIPRGILFALQRGDHVAGRFFPIPGRWHQICPCCKKVVFLAFPLYMTPAIEPLGDMWDEETYVKTHPCKFWDEDVAWDLIEEPPPAKGLNLKDYL